MRTRSKPWLAGPPPALPAVVDAAVERWWSLPPRVRMLVIGALAAVVVAAALAGRSADPWGPAVEVVVAARELQPGEVVDATAVEVVRRPAAAVPDGALEAGAALELPLAAPVPAGAALTAGHLAPAGPAALLGPGRAAVALAADGLPALVAGQVVDVLAQSPQGQPTVLAGSARVLATDGEHLWLAVARTEAPAVVAAAGWGAVGVALLPVGSPAELEPAATEPTASAAAP